MRWYGPGLSTAVSSTAVSSTLGSFNPVSSTIKFLVCLFDQFCLEYNTMQKHKMHLLAYPIQGCTHSLTLQCLLINTRYYHQQGHTDGGGVKGRGEGGRRIGEEGERGNIPCE